MKKQIKMLLDDAIANGQPTFEVFPMVTEGRGRYLEVLEDKSKECISAFKSLGLSYTESYFEDRSGTVLKKFEVAAKAKAKKTEE